MLTTNEKLKQWIDAKDNIMKKNRGYYLYTHANRAIGIHELMKTNTSPCSEGMFLFYGASDVLYTIPEEEQPQELKDYFETMNNVVPCSCMARSIISQMHPEHHALMQKHGEAQTRLIEYIRNLK